MINISIVFLDQKFNEFKVAVVSSFVERSHFGFMSEGGVDEFRPLLKQQLYVFKVAAFDVIMQVFFVVGLY